jgi:hypothetical protein
VGDGCGLTRGQRHGGGAFNRVEGDASTCRPKVPRGEGGVPRAGSGSNPKSGSRSGMDPTGGACLAVRERGREEERRVGLGKEGAKRLGRLGCAGEKEKGRLG